MSSFMSSSESYTIVVLFKFATIGSWRRIIDFKQRTSDNGLYTYGPNLQFYGPMATGAEASVESNSYMQVVLTRDDVRNVAGYVNGSLQIEFVDSSGYAVLSTHDTLNFFRDDLVYANEHSAGAVARLTIYDEALSDEQVAALPRLGAQGVEPPVISSASNVHGTVSSPFSYQIVATNDPVSFTATGLPSWASLDNATGIISGTPTQAGISSLAIGAINAAGTGTATLSIEIAPESGTVLCFSQSTFKVDEGVGNAAITVYRLGAAAACSVSYAISGVSAAAGVDYETASGTLHFSASDSVQTFTVAIVDDDSVESIETAEVQLTNALGATLVAPATAVLSIRDDDYGQTAVGPAVAAGTHAVAPRGLKIIDWNGNGGASMRLSYTLEAASPVVVSLLDQRGAIVTELFNGHRSAGEHIESISIPHVAAGMYVLRLSRRHGVETRLAPVVSR